MDEVAEQTSRVQEADVDVKDDSEQPEDPSEPQPEEPGEATEDPTEEPAEEPAGYGAELSDEELVRSVFALLFAAPTPVSVARLGQLTGRPGKARVQTALEAIETRLAEAGLPLELRGIAGGWTVLTTEDVGDVVAGLAKQPGVERVSPAALETLAVVAYRQPVTKADIEAIRGVQVGPILRTLVDRGLVRVLGRADVPGHPLQYGTTQAFLERFGLMSLDDLPRDAELTRD